VFGTFGAVLVNGQPYQPIATDLALASAIQGYWTRFARGGDPGGAPTWPAYGPTDPALVFDATVSTAAAIRKADCDFWRPPITRCDASRAARGVHGELPVVRCARWRNRPACA
jgi:carboxylesterase type B